MTATPPYDVFISASNVETNMHADFLWAKLRKRKHGLRVFFCGQEDSIHLGEEYGQILLQRLDEAQTVILVLTDCYLGREWCCKEMHRSVMNTWKMKIPVYAPQVSPSTLGADPNPHNAQWFNTQYGFLGAAYYSSYQV
jgi:TIR domain